MTRDILAGVSGDVRRDRSHDRIRGFDGLRGIAFLLVFASHKIYFSHEGSYGDAGVWLFFVLSGFLITRILAKSRAEIEEGMTTFRASIFRFYLRRTARIFPPYYMLLTLLAALALFVSISHFAAVERLAYWLYATNFLIAARGEWIGPFGHLWSLAVEEQFYLLLAPFILLTPRAHTMRICLAILAAGVATKVAFEVSGESPIQVDVNSLINFSFLGYGGAIGLMTKKWEVPKWLSGGAAQAAVLLLYVALPTAFDKYPSWGLFSELTGLLVGVLLFQIFHQQQSWFVGLLESAPLRNLGRISYGTYLVHSFVNFTSIGLFLQSHGVAMAVYRPIQVAAEFSVTILVAAISWHFMERPIMGWAARTGQPAPAKLESS
jgi:peptidoglycan/LPS O-acetylase OafA/YrhL